MFSSLWRLVRPRQDGERVERLTNTLLAPKMEDDIVRSAVVLTSLRRRDDVAPELRFQGRVDGLLTRKTMILSWLRRNIVSDDASSSTPMCASDDDALHLWRRVAYLPASSALAVRTGRHTKNTRATQNIWRGARVNLQPTGDRMVTTLPTESQR